MAKQKVEIPKRGMPKIPKSRLWNLAKKITNMPKDPEAVYNTLKEIHSDAFGEGYERRIDDCRAFKQAREKSRIESFNSFKDTLDDLIHDKR